MSVTLFIIDPQNDFCDPGSGRLYVQGAERDMDRLTTLVQRAGNQVSSIVVTLDTHQRLDISHPLWWRDAVGKPPPPFTVIAPDDLSQGKWRTAIASDQSRSESYVAALDANGRYPHVVWPEHCLMGHPGHNVWPALHDALSAWEEARQSRVHYVTKGLNPYTEHFSAIQAEVPDPSDPRTQPDLALVEHLSSSDTLWVAGEARSHCVANTVRDLLRISSREDLPQRTLLLMDTMSDVPGFEALGERFVSDMALLGVQMTASTSSELLA